MNKIKPVVIAWTIAALWLIAVFVVMSALSDGSALATYLVTWGTTTSSSSTTSTTTTTTTCSGACVLKEIVFDESGCVCDSNNCINDGQITHMYFCNVGDCSCHCEDIMGPQLVVETPLCQPGSCDETSECYIWGWWYRDGDAPASCNCHE